MEIHRTAEVGFTKGAGDYEAARPTYPPEALQWAFDVCGWTSESLILDLAAGTGKLTRDLATRSRVIAVEPVEAMRQQFAKVLPHVPMIAGVAEAVPAIDASFDGVTVAQAFHWFDSVRATRELHRVLRPDGSLMLIWNTRTRSNEVMAAVWDLVDSFGKKIPKYRDSVEHEGLPPTELFVAIGRRDIPHAQPVTPEVLLARIASTSFIAALADERRGQLMQEVDALVTPHLSADGHIDVPYVAEVFCYTKA